MGQIPAAAVAAESFMKLRRFNEYLDELTSFFDISSPPGFAGF
jgi:hypothetical protein